ncbi:unnamed protein product [Sphagnum troendelagicum]|uniref:Uncharacterized protein n=1 Tax=Sphagnum troendelagicum TaxID=128251 RepID=A0ABP0TG56_9BRYO
MPLPWVPGEVLNKPRFEDPEYWSLLVWGLQFFGDPKARPRAFLREDPNREVGACGYGDCLVRGGLNASFGCHSLEFDHSSVARGGFEDEINPFEWGAGQWLRVANPVPVFQGACTFRQRPGNAGYDGFLTLLVQSMESHSELVQAFPFLAFAFPKVLDSRASCTREGIAFA